MAEVPNIQYPRQNPPVPVAPPEAQPAAPPVAQPAAIAAAVAPVPNVNLEVGFLLPYIVKNFTLSLVACKFTRNSTLCVSCYISPSC